MLWDLQKFNDNTAIITESEKITYNGLAQKSLTLAKKIRKRCLVFLFAQNTVGSLVGYIGCINNHIVPVMLDSKLDKQFIQNLVSLYHPAYFWLPDERKNEFTGLQEIISYLGYSLLCTGELEEPVLHNDLALLMTTSGSTGSPKLVRQSYCNLIENTKSIVQYLKISATDTTITTLPMYYVYGLSVINTYLWCGARIVMTEKNFFEKDFWRFFNEESVTSFAGVPYSYEILNKLRFFKMDLPDLKVLTQAGGKLSSELQRKFGQYALENQKKFVVMYGAAEATSRMGYLPPEKVVEKCGSIGVAIPGGEYAIIDENGKIVDKPNVKGELVYYGKNVTWGYAESAADLGKGDENKGCLQTGDIAFFDEDGYYYIVGRKKRFLKIFGKRVSLDEMESLLKDAFPNEELACAGVDDTVYVFVVNENGFDIIKSFIANKIGINRAAVKVKKIDTLPKNESGKIMYKDLVKYYD